VYRLWWIATAVPASYWVLNSNAILYWSYQSCQLFLLLRRKHLSFSRNRNVERVNRPSGALRGGGAFLARTSTFEKSAQTGPPFSSVSRRTDRHRAPTRHAGKPPYPSHCGRPTPSHPSLPPSSHVIYSRRCRGYQWAYEHSELSSKLLCSVVYTKLTSGVCSNPPFCEPPLDDGCRLGTRHGELFSTRARLQAAAADKRRAICRHLRLILGCGSPPSKGQQRGGRIWRLGANRVGPLIFVHVAEDVSGGRSEFSDGRCQAPTQKCHLV